MYYEIDTISAVSSNITFMRTRLTTWDDGDVNRVFPQFCAEYTSTLYLKTLHYYCVNPSEKSQESIDIFIFNYIVHDKIISLV